jgi:hypothetical protein
MANDRFYMRGTDARKPGAALAIFERLMGRSCDYSPALHVREQLVSMP